MVYIISELFGSLTMQTAAICIHNEIFVEMNKLMSTFTITAGYFGYISLQETFGAAF